MYACGQYEQCSQAVYAGYVPRRPKKNDQPQPPQGLDLNQVVSYNLRAARELRGWTQEDLAARLEFLVGTRPTQATISALERAWDGDRRREFDVQELAVYAMALDLPILWFLLPPPGDHREIQGIGRSLDDLYILLLGRQDQLEPLYERLRQVGIEDPTPAEETVEKITGAKSIGRQWSYKQRRKDLLLAVLDEHADDLDRAAEEIGSFFDHLRQVGIKGFVAENTFDDDFVTQPQYRTGAADEPE